VEPRDLTGSIAATGVVGMITGVVTGVVGVLLG
jgi:hypothetical protein